MAEGYQSDAIGVDHFSEFLVEHVMLEEPKRTVKLPEIIQELLGEFYDLQSRSSQTESPAAEKNIVIGPMFHPGSRNQFTSPQSS